MATEYIFNPLNNKLERKPRANTVTTDVSDFDHHLSSSDTTVQKALDTLDDITKVTVGPTEPSIAAEGDVWVDIS